MRKRRSSKYRNTDDQDAEAREQARFCALQTLYFTKTPTIPLLIICFLHCENLTQRIMNT